MSPTLDISEFSIEAQLPLLAYYTRGLDKLPTLVPIIVGELESKESLDGLAQLIKKCLNNPKTLLIISTDLNHVGHHYDNYTKYFSDVSSTLFKSQNIIRN